MTLKKITFTLTEALVVMSLVMILMSLISPSLHKFTRHSREVSCSAGVRNLLTITHVYAEDYNGNFPEIQKNLATGEFIGVAFFAFRYWADLFESEYGVSQENWYSPSNPNWSYDMFYKYNNGIHMVMGRSFFGAPSMQSTFNARVLDHLKGSPTFASKNFESPKQKVLWTDINRKLNGTDYFVNNVPGGVKNGANHLYDLNSNWPELSHNGMIDGSVDIAYEEEIEARFKKVSSVNHW